MRPTIKEVALRAGVTAAVVSRIVNEDSTLVVRKETRRRVLEAIKELNYHPNAVARSLKLKQTNTIGLFVPSMSSMSHLNIIMGAQFAADELGYAVLLCCTGDAKDKEQKYFNLMMEKQVDGLILASVHSEDDIIDLMNESEVPYVLINRDSSDDNSLFVGSDDFKGGKMATEYLLEKGHKRIGHIAGWLFTNTAIGRLKGYKAALHNAGISLPSEYTVESAYAEREAYLATKKLLKLKDIPTAIFAASDEIAFGCIDAIRDTGLSVPEDVSVIGYGDTWICGKVSPPLTTIHTSLYEMGYIAVRKLVRRIRSEEIGSCKTMLPLKIAERDSVRNYTGL